MALTIGITGGIGSGKTTVTGIFQVLGIPVFNADTEARRLMENEPLLKQAILQKFGPAAYHGGHLNRKYLAGIVFNDPLQLQLLNSLVHPYTMSAAEHWAQKQQSPYIIKEAALFFEAGTATGIDFMIGVYSPKHIRIKRVMERDKLTRDEVVIRMQRQIQEEIKMRLCDYVIMNDEQQLLIPQVLTLHDQFLNQAQDV